MKTLIIDSSLKPLDNYLTNRGFFGMWHLDPTVPGYYSFITSNRDVMNATLDFFEFEWPYIK